MMSYTDLAAWTFAVAVVACCGCAADELADVDPKYKEVSALPDGLRVTHTPDPAKARRGGPSGEKYTWIYKTSVESLGEVVSITEFGAFVQDRGHWVFSTYTGKPFTPKDFAEWYSCPNATLASGTSHNDPNNWGGAEELRQDKALWYFIGVTPAGKKVKGWAEITQAAEVAGK